MNSLKNIINETPEFTIESTSGTPEKLESAAPSTWPILSDKALYGLAGNIVRAATENSEADPAAILLTALTHSGAAFGSQARIRVGETNHPPRLMSALVGASSRARKGTSADPIRRIFERAETIHALPPLQVSHGPLSSGEGVVYAVRDPGDKRNKSGELEDEGVNDKRLVVYEGELGGALKAIQRDGNTLSSILRTSWDHGDMAPLTKSNRIKATGAHVCIIGHITRHELKVLLQTSDVWNGLANRFLWVCARRQKMVPFPKAMDGDLVDELSSELAKAIKTASDIGIVSLASNTIEIWKALYPMISQDESGILGVVTARAEAQVLRLALIYALLDRSSTILPEHLEAALAVWQYCHNSARYIFGDTEADPDSNKILLALAEGDKSQTQLNELFNGHLPADRLNAILTDLQAVGRITQRKEGGGRGKGKAITWWSITPGFTSIGADLAELEE
ncbi:MAG: DUF3987 domain-containing protein [Candidatus Obscuribacterales bacterium]|nr:DUF3987 domain-containing protein [Candidatus Obscuribacterales bacterium]